MKGKNLTECMSGKMIVIVSAVFPPEPVVSAIISYDLARKLAEEGEQKVIVLCPKPTRPNGKLLDVIDFSQEKFERIELPSYVCPASRFLGRMRESISFGKYTAEYLHEHSKDISCVYMNTWPLFAQYYTVNAAKKYNIPSILHIQDIYPESMLPRLRGIGYLLGRVLLAKEKRELKKASAILTISDNMKYYLARTRNLSINSMHVIRNWQDEKPFMKKYLVSKDKFTFMFVGSISPAAGVLFLIQSFVRLNRKDIRLVIAGDGSDKRKCVEFALLNKELDISFCSVNPDTVPERQAQADVLLLPLKKGVGKTASPSKLPAYMFSSKPILACVDEGSDVEYIIKTSKCGWLCPAEDIESLTKLMGKIISAPEDERIAMGVQARKFALEEMTKEANLTKLISVFSKIIR